MKLTSGPVRQVVADAVTAAERAQLDVLARFLDVGGELAEWVPDSEVDKVELLRGGRPVADLYTANFDTALLFEHGTTKIIGDAIQHGFKCKDRALWAEIADLPPLGVRASLSYDVEDVEDDEFEHYEELERGE